MPTNEITAPTRELVLDQLGARQWATTGIVARALLPHGGRGIPHRLRRAHHEQVRELLRQLHEDGLVVWRWRPVEDEGEGHGRKEWRLA